MKRMGGVLEPEMEDQKLQLILWFTELTQV